MADLKDKKVEDELQVKKIRMIVTSRNPTDLEAFTTKVIANARGIEQMHFRPSRISYFQGTSQNAHKAP